MSLSSENFLTSLYNSEVELSFNPRSHRYKVTDRGEDVGYVPSITTICGVIDKPFLIPWAVNKGIEFCRECILPGECYSEIFLEGVFNAARKAHQQIKEQAGLKGREVHQVIEDFIRPTPPRAESDAADSYTEDVSGYKSAAISWLGSHEVQPLEVERRVYSRRLKVSGTLDTLAWVDGCLAVADWKSSKGVYPSYWLQLSAYARFYEEETGEQIEKTYIVHLKSDGTVEEHVHNKSQIAKDFRAFRGATALYMRLRELERS